MPVLSSARVQLPRPAAWLLRVAALAAVYYAAARLGLRYASIGQSISLVWPPTGVALAALCLAGFLGWTLRRERAEAAAARAVPSPPAA